MAGDHKCPVCNATFTRPQHVARHMRSHTGDRPYKCQHCGDQFARSDLLSRHVNKCHAAEKPATTTAPNRRKGSASASRATTSKQACDQCVVTNLPCDGSNPCSKCLSRKCRCTYVKFHRQTAPVGPGHPTPTVPGERNSQQHPHFSMDTIIPSEEYLLSHPQNAAAALPGMGGVGIYHHNTMPSTDFTFPVPMYSRSSSLPVAAAGHQHSSQSPPDQGSPDFATRYRAQAELLSRAGVLPHGQISIPNPMHGSSHPNPHSGVVGINDGVNILPSQPQLYNSDQRFSLSSASWGSGRQSHDPMDGVLFHSNRPHSQAGYPGSLPSSFSSTASDSYDFRHGNLESMDDLSDSTSEHGHSEHGHSSSDHSFYDSPSVAQSVPNHLMISGQKPGQEHHEGVSSAFGLMSLDDPNVLAGIASDGTPFFTNINVNGENGITLPLPHHVRDDMTVGMGPKPLPNKLEGSHELNGGGGNGLTPRDFELRELKEFWKQYMRTPLTGPHQSGSANGFPLATPTPNNVHGHGQLEAPNNRTSPSKKLSRVTSLPSVKTPPLRSDIGPMGHAQINSHHQYHNDATNEGIGQASSNNGVLPPRANTHVDSQMGADDLKSYEQAVLARKTPTLNLVPRKRPGTVGGDVSSGGRFSNPSTTSSSPVVPPRLLASANRTTFSVDPGIYSRPSSADSNESDGGTASRPSFKRLPSTTLEPANAKRTLLSVSGDEWSGSGDGSSGHMTRAGNNPNGGREGVTLGGGLTMEPSSTIMNMQMSVIAAQDRHRRLSAPVAVHHVK